MRIVASTAIAAFALAFAASHAASADPWKIRVGWVTTPGHMQPVIDELQKRHPELFHHFGQSYVAAGVHFQGTTPQIQALAINELEIASFGPEALALAVDNAHLDVRMIADVFQDGVPGYSSITFAVKADSPIKTIDDLKGKRVATNAIGSFGDSAMRVNLRLHGISDRDITSVEAPFPTMPAMLDDGKVDMIILVPQYEYMVKEGKYRVLFRAVQGYGRIQAVLWAMRADQIAAHRAALVDFLEDHIRAVQWLTSAAHHKEAVDLISEVTKLKPETLDFAYTKDDSYHAPDGKPDVAGTQHALDVEMKYGLIHDTLTVAPKYVDLGPVEDAAKRLGGS
ncbi:MAG TPA: ABC transporter substrate-binding protein [Stellaceae bacterium]|nr:ABC transporter substrate-binding protein [Stellaceae bacterium]